MFSIWITLFYSNFYKILLIYFLFFKVLSKKFPLGTSAFLANGNKKYTCIQMKRLLLILLKIF